MRLLYGVQWQASIAENDIGTIVFNLEWRCAQDLRMNWIVVDLRHMEPRKLQIILSSMPETIRILKSQISNIG